MFIKAMLNVLSPKYEVCSYTKNDIIIVANYDRRSERRECFAFFVANNFN